MDPDLREQKHILRQDYYQAADEADKALEAIAASAKGLIYLLADLSRARVSFGFDIAQYDKHWTAAAWKHSSFVSDQLMRMLDRYCDALVDLQNAGDNYTKWLSEHEPNTTPNDQ